MRILVLNGPNLNLLGTREPDIYGGASLDDIAHGLERAFPDVAFEFVQSNHEGALIDALQRAEAEAFLGAVLNPGAFGHTSVALRDAVSAVKRPVVEVHISNVHAREDFRRNLVIAPAAAGCISGLGVAGYHLAVRYLVEQFGSGARIEREQARHRT